MKEEAARISKKDFDSRCPLCKSQAIYRIGEHRANSRGSYSYVDCLEAEVEEWRCAVCFGSFILF
jgi:hypothetical protein